MAEPLSADDDSVDLEHFESLAYGRKRQDAVSALGAALNRLKRGREFARHVVNDETRAALYSRFAAAISALVCDPDFALTTQEFDRLAVGHATLCAIFRSSVFENSDHLLRQFGSADPGNPGRLEFPGQESIAKLLLTYALDSGMDIDLSQIFKVAPQWSLSAFLGRVGQPAPVSPDGQARWNALLALGPLFEDVTIEEHLVDAIAEAYFQCSYSDMPEKHRIKRTLNILLRRFIESRGLLPDALGARQLRDRPTALVLIERFRSDHAVYRYFGPCVRKLRERFRLVALGPASEFDAVSKACFDETIGLPDGAVSFPAVLAHARSLEPDIVFYPSIGMSPWAIALSNVRLAPIQAMTIGHPATTLSPEIDYVLLSEAFAGDRRCFSETVIAIEGSFSMAQRPGAKVPEPRVREHPAAIRIAVPAAIMKLNARFLASCQAIARKARRPVMYEFFPHCTAMDLFQIARQIGKWLPGAVVHGAADYNDYLHRLAGCDIHLSPYPFGGGNSNFDSMQLGIPMVTLLGDEAHSRTDAGMMRAVGMPEWLIGHNIGEFEDAAVRLVENDGERLAIARQLLSTDIAHVFFDRPGNRNTQDFLDALWFVYRNHEAICASGRRSWTIGERTVFERDR